MLLLLNHFIIQFPWNFLWHVLHPFLGSCPFPFTMSKQIEHSSTPDNFLSMFSFHKRIALITLVFLLCNWLWSINTQRLLSSIFKPSPNSTTIGLHKNISTLRDKYFASTFSNRFWLRHECILRIFICCYVSRRFRNFLRPSTEVPEVQFDQLPPGKWPQSWYFSIVFHIGFDISWTFP